MFTKARIKLTAWYLAVIMTVSLSFSAVIYAGVNQELVRIENNQRMRIQRIINGIPQPFQLPPGDTDAIAEARTRILTTLAFVNMTIFLLAGGLGYFLAGRTLDPIKKNMDDQKAFISDASHELRTPLTSLKTEIEVSLRDKNFNIKDAKNLLHSNLEDVDRIQKLANYLLRMNKLEQGTNLTKSKVDLKEIADEAVGKLDINKKLLSTKVYANKEALIELASILIDNARKYGQGKPIEIKTKNKTLLVSDRGMGISKEDLPHIFDRFYRSDKSRGTEGYGLGLSIARLIADQNGANIKVESKIGKGSTFKVTF